MITSVNGNATAISQSYEAQGGVSAFELDLFGKNASLSRAAFETYLANSEAAKSTRLTLIADIVTDWVAPPPTAGCPAASRHGCRARCRAR